MFNRHWAIHIILYDNNYINFICDSFVFLQLMLASLLESNIESVYHHFFLPPDEIFVFQWNNGEVTEEKSWNHNIHLCYARIWQMSWNMENSEEVTCEKDQLDCRDC